MRSEGEIQAALELLTGMLVDGQPEGLDLDIEAELDMVAAMRDALCWVLAHGHETTIGSLTRVTDLQKRKLELEQLKKKHGQHHRPRNSHRRE